MVDAQNKYNQRYEGNHTEDAWQRGNNKVFDAEVLEMEYG